MYRIVSFIIIFLFVSTMLYFHNQNSHYQASDQDNHHGHEMVNIPTGIQAPSIDGKVEQDPSGSWLLKIETEQFTFAPEKAGADQVNYDEGHAHLYLDGEKVNRLYGNYYNLGELKKGTHQIKVTLNANNHDILAVGGQEIAYKETFKVK
ncbi:hypothetical protein [Mesobacillus jeotgali]|uniref:YtkA-like domain-containing protein n=1 Tax=Mesobacillus jeotgali TaxID=129985 RepID=A0ABY9VGA8_9BACI|nr:hypothetical protein [Mesobacillus jeotgali]WNF22933.1 hypothetical protein RH061_22765 [Mesobacillus jeotgali]